MKRMTTRFIIILLVCCIVSPSYGFPFKSSKEFGNIQTITGRILDQETGEPIMGASVLVKGTSIGSSTDASGRFNLKVPDGEYILVISGVGYGTQEMKVGDQRQLTVKLSKLSQTLNDVVVVGYGTQRKATLTGAVSQIKGDILKKSPNGNLSNNLTGRIPGLIALNRTGEPGSDGSSFSIRGTASFRNSDAGPLIVVDGIPDRSFSRLNPDDIESISVLKDASAAIYGVRAANGVILITTKRGKNGKPTINYSGIYALQSVTRYADLVNAAQYATYFNEISDRLGQPRQYSDEDIKLYADGSDPLGHPSTNWYDAVIRKNAPQTQHSLSLSGGSENIKYFLSGEYLYQEYLYKESPFNYNQKNIRANIDANVSKNLKVSLDLAGRNEERNDPLTNASDNAGIFMTILASPPTLAAKYPNGLPGMGVAVGGNPLLLAGDAGGYAKKLGYFVTATGKFELKMPFITEGLNLSGYVALDNTFYQNKSLSRPYDTYLYDANTKEYVNFRTNTNGNNVSLSEDVGRWRRNTYNFQLNYAHQFGVHDVSGFVGYEESDYFLEQISVTRRNLLSDQLPFIGQGGSDPANLGNGGYGDQNGRRSVFGRVNYNYADKYLFEFSGRYNGSYNFAPGKKYGFFPGISAGWVLTKENFLKKNLDFADLIKIRASWGVLGDDAIGAYQYLGLYNLADPGYFFGTEGTPVPGLTTGVSPNPNFTWEKVDSRDIGIETSFWKGKLDINFDYFIRKRYDILTTRNASIPSYSGLQGHLPPENIGKANSKGYEIELIHRGRIGADFTYNVSANFTHTNNKIIFSDEAANVLPYQKTTGFPIRSFLIYETDGIYNTQEEIDSYTNSKGAAVSALNGTKPGDIKYVDVNNDGKITSADRVRFFDSPVPKNVYGLNFSVNYKGFELGLLFYGQEGAKQIILPQATNAPFNPPVWQFDDRWTPQNINSNRPAAFDRTNSVDNRSSDFWLYDVSFLRLKTAELGYNLPKSIVNRLKIANARIFVNGSNLFLLSKLKNYDPELNPPFMNGAYYPQTRLIGIGLNVSF